MTADGPEARNVRPAAGSPAPGASPLDESQFVLVEEGSRRYTMIQKAARVARGSAVITLVLGVFAALFVALWPSLTDGLVAAGLLAIGTMEYMGCRKMRRADPAAARLLALNQLAFLGLIVLYCAIEMLTFSVADVKAAALSPEFREQLNAMPDFAHDIDSKIEKWGPLLTYGFYALVIVLSLGFQGGMALYYYTRRKHLDAFLRDTPPWVQRIVLQSASAAR